MDVSLPVGSAPPYAGPLARFVPPMDYGVIGQILTSFDLPGSHILDPFGVSPRVAIEAAKSDRAVVVISNNPINRFVLEYTLHPISIADLRTALAQIAALPKDGMRMENFILDLYKTNCARCGATVSVDFFIWDKDLGGPTRKVYACDACAHAGEVPATEEDWERALDYSRRGLHHAMAVEQVAPRGDPDRKHAETALAAYPGRAIYAITTLLNKVQQLQLEKDLQAAVDALLLSAFDAGNSLWGYPDGRERPRQLIASQQYREFNLWRAMEEALGVWAMEDPGVQSRVLETEIQLVPGVVHIFHGSYAKLNEILGPGSLDHLLTVPPRPNQAFWTLSALWAAWLWGQSAAAPIKVALRRRRYDWAWHAGAMHTVIQQISPLLKKPSRSVVYLPESEPGFFSALMTSFDAAGYDLQGRALRAHEGHAVTLWEHRDPSELRLDPGVDSKALGAACREVLERRCEPASYAVVHAAGWSYLTGNHHPRAIRDADTRQGMQILGEKLSQVLNDPELFQRFGRGVELETGLYWVQGRPDCGLSLFDRVEQLVLEQLRAGKAIQVEALDRKTCHILQGLETPGKRLVLAALQSYGEPSEEGFWKLRPEDFEKARAEDAREMQADLASLGEQLGFEVEHQERVNWFEGGQLEYQFLIRETAILGDIPLQRTDRLILVMPGGRASLLAEKSRRDPRLRDWLQSSPRVLKYRHVRRLVSESTLRRENLNERLSIDPPEHQDPQLPLL